MTKKLREKIFDRDNYTCQWCGANDLDLKQLLPAHIRTASLCGDDRESNLITLCRYCYNHVLNKEIMRKFETAENKAEFSSMFQQRVDGYCYYTKYIYGVFSRNGISGTRPQIDKFVKASITTEEDFKEFKKDLENPQNARKIMTTCIINKISYREYKNKENCG